MVKELLTKPIQDSVYYDYMLEVLGEIDKKSKSCRYGWCTSGLPIREQITGKHWREPKGDAIELHYKQLEMMKSFG